MEKVFQLFKICCTIFWKLFTSLLYISGPLKIKLELNNSIEFYQRFD